MTSSVLPTSTTYAEPLKPKLPHQVPELISESGAERVYLRQPLDDKRNCTNATDLCERCRKLKLGKMLTQETEAKSIGNLKLFNGQYFQLCCIIKQFVMHHWECERPLVLSGRRPEVHIQSKRWASFSNSESSKRNVYRIMLDRRAPDLNLSRRALNSDPISQFVLTELEIDPTTARHGIDLPSLRRPIPPCVDLDMVNSWVQACNIHGHCKENQVSQKSNIRSFFKSKLRLTDVEQEMLVIKTNLCNYVALSYVWVQL